MEQLGVDKKDALYVGDTKTDVKTGENAGVRTLIVGRDIEKVTDILKTI